MPVPTFTMLRNARPTKCRLITMTSLIVALFSMKLLCFFAYFSTDFEVHRNWLAITYSLPLNKWYAEKTSQWTLDYPPFFAWFEYLLARMAVFADSNMVKISAKPYVSSMTILFQRFTVLLCDALYVIVALRLCKLMTHPKTTFILLCLNAPLFIVDSVHFQYNALLFSLLIVSINLVKSRQYLLGFSVFVFLLHMKHLFIYLLPAYTAYLLPVYCDFHILSIGSTKQFLTSSAKLAFVTLAISTLSLGPFLYNGQSKLLMDRLFPFKRGLTHAYWAPNFWALYNFVDYVLQRMGSRYGFVSRNFRAGYTGGIVGDVTHAVLPSVTPKSALFLTIILMTPFCLCVVWKRRSDCFVKAICACAFCSFLVGWHVHEKAILTILVPLTLLATNDKRYARTFMLISLIGSYSLFPLLFGPMDVLVKYPVAIVFCAVCHWALKRRYGGRDERLLTTLDTLYLFGLIPIEVFNLVAPFTPSYNYFPFLPLMLISVYCAVGVLYTFFTFSKFFFTDFFSK